MKSFFVLMGLAAAAMIVADAEAFRITTAGPGGADVELRKSMPNLNRGDSTEIASRVASNRNSLIYLKFGVADISATNLLYEITVRTTYRNNNLRESRFYDPVAGYTGWDYYVLDPTVDGADWDEATIAPTTDAVAGTVQPPGYFYDGDYGTKGVYDFLGMLNPDLTYLGQKLYDSADLVGANPHLPVGQAFDFTLSPGSALHDAIIAAQGTDHQTVTIVMTIDHEYVEGATPANWVDFNYMFNPKEMTVLNDDPDSPWGGASNANHDFSPQLLIIPEPATMVLLGLGGLLLHKKTYILDLK